MIYITSDELKTFKPDLRGNLHCPGPFPRFSKCVKLEKHCHCYLSPPLHNFEGIYEVSSLKQLSLALVSRALLNNRTLSLIGLYLPNVLCTEILRCAQNLYQGNCICHLLK